MNFHVITAKYDTVTTAQAAARFIRQGLPTVAMPDKMTFSSEAPSFQHSWPGTTPPTKSGHCGTSKATKWLNRLRLWISIPVIIISNKNGQDYKGDVEQLQKLQRGSHTLLLHTTPDYILPIPVADGRRINPLPWDSHIFIRVWHPIPSARGSI